MIQKQVITAWRSRLTWQVRKIWYNNKVYDIWTDITTCGRSDGLKWSVLFIRMLEETISLFRNNNTETEFQATYKTTSPRAITVSTVLKSETILKHDWSFFNVVSRGTVFRGVRKIAKSDYQFRHACPHETPRLPLTDCHEIWCSRIFFFRKSVRDNSSLINIWQE